MRGAARDRHERAVRCDGRKSAEKTIGVFADGEVVWSRCLDADITLAERSADNGGNKADRRGDHEGNR